MADMGAAAAVARQSSMNEYDAAMPQYWIVEQRPSETSEYWGDQPAVIEAIDRLDCMGYGGLTIQQRDTSRSFLSVAGCRGAGYLVWFEDESVGLAAIGHPDAKGLADMLVGNQMAEHPVRQLVTREVVDQAVDWFLRNERPAPDVLWQDDDESWDAAIDPI